MGLKTRGQVLRKLGKRELVSSSTRHMGQVRMRAYELPDTVKEMETDELEDLVMSLGDIEWDAKRAKEYIEEIIRREEGK